MSRVVSGELGDYRVGVIASHGTVALWSLFIRYNSMFSQPTTNFSEGNTHIVPLSDVKLMSLSGLGGGGGGGGGGTDHKYRQNVQQNK